MPVKMVFERDLWDVKCEDCDVLDASITVGISVSEDDRIWVQLYDTLEPEKRKYIQLEKIKSVKKIPKNIAWDIQMEFMRYAPSECHAILTNEHDTNTIICEIMDTLSLLKQRWIINDAIVDNKDVNFQVLPRITLTDGDEDQVSEVNMNGDLKVIVSGEYFDIVYNDHKNKEHVHELVMTIVDLMGLTKAKNKKKD